jgi:uncharacterized membrane protein YbhN (UPF0104 family)
MNAALSVTARRTRRLAGPVVSLVSLAAVVWWALRQQAPRWPAGASSLLLLALALVVYAGVTAVRGVRWHRILRGAGVPASMADTQALVIVGYMGNTVLPARGGELLRMFFMGERTGCSRITILGTIVAERVLDIVALSSMLVGLALVTAAGTRSLLVLGLLAAVVLAALALSLTLAWRVSRAGRLGGRVASFTLASRNLVGRQGALLLALTAVVWIGEGCLYWLVGVALDVHLSFLDGCLLVALSSLAAAIPAAPGYVGTYDASIQFGLRALHVQGGAAVAFGLLVRLLIFVPITLVGLVLVIVRYGGRTSLARLHRAGTAAQPIVADPEGAITASSPAAPAAASLADGRSLLGSSVGDVSDLLEMVK